ncbi:M20/M25/M40 family metallo-hydrolase [Streptomyces sp. NPDC004111]|uniref:M20/M25/M40 family metallo-hydrolase n=1 Tax=Streptomyces sp. NPDC004111 TaxID=3364690 RepID=UPI003674DE01
MDTTASPLSPGTREAAARVAGLMPELTEELTALVALDSVAFPGFPAEPVLRTARATAELLRRSGATDARLLDIPDGYPAVYAEVPGPPGAPTVLLYAHYDVQPAPEEQEWETDPWTATTGADGRLYGRGAADDKSGVVAHAATLRAYEGRPPVTLRILIEGEEETVSHLGPYVTAHPELFACDAFVIADMGNIRTGEPALTTTLRGTAVCDLRVTTLRAPVHSGVFGGPVPDAFVALSRIVASLHDDAGNVAVPGLHGADWPGADMEAGELRAASGLVEGVEVIGSGSVASHLWSRPSVSVLGVDVPPRDGAPNVLHASAAARISLRVPPGADAAHELGLLMEHLHAVAPWGVRVETEAVKAGSPFRADTEHPALAAAQQALSTAFDRPAGRIGSGGAIGLVATLHSVAPGAGVILWGAEDMAGARIHAGNESVDLDELRRIIEAQTLFLGLFAAGADGAGSRDGG